MESSVTFQVAPRGMLRVHDLFRRNEVNVVQLKSYTLSKTHFPLLLTYYVYEAVLAIVISP